MSYDLILMDIQDAQNGRIRRHPGDPYIEGSSKRANIPIVAMTANALEGRPPKAFKAGMNAHIAKPIDVNILMGTLDRVFKQNS